MATPTAPTPSDDLPSGSDGAAREQPTPSAGGRNVKHRPVLVWVLIVLAALIGFVATLTTWVNRQMLDTRSWTKSSSQLLQDPKIRSALSVYIVNELYDNVSVEGELQKRLPPQVAPLAGPISAGLRGPAQQIVDRLLQRPRVVALWIDTNRIAHAQFVAIVENKNRPGVSTANGVVTLDVSELVRSLGQQVGVPAGALDGIPQGAGHITVLRSDQLSLVQKGVRGVRLLSVWLIVLDFVLWGLALYFAAGARRAALRDIGWSVFVVGALLLVVRHVLGNYVVNALTTTASKPAGIQVWAIMTGILGEIGLACVFYGLAIVAGAILAGPTRVGTAIRGWIAPVLNRTPVVASGTVAFAYILLVAWGPTHALRTPIGILVLGLLIALGVYLLRRETLAEFPAGSVPHRASSVASAEAALASHRQSFRSHRHHDDSSVPAQLERLDGLRASGVISDDEFRQAKEKVLA
jgi:hypothetical protein